MESPTQATGVIPKPFFCISRPVQPGKAKQKPYCRIFWKTGNFSSPSGSIPAIVKEGKYPSLACNSIPFRNLTPINSANGFINSCVPGSPSKNKFPPRSIYSQIIRKSPSGILLLTSAITKISTSSGILSFPEREKSSTSNP